MTKHFGIVSIVNKFTLQGTLTYFDMLNVYKNTNLHDYSHDKVIPQCISCTPCLSKTYNKKQRFYYVALQILVMTLSFMSNFGKIHVCRTVVWIIISNFSFEICTLTGNHHSAQNSHCFKITKSWRCLVMSFALPPQTNFMLIFSRPQS